MAIPSAMTVELKDVNGQAVAGNLAATFTWDVGPPMNVSGTSPIGAGPLGPIPVPPGATKLTLDVDHGDYAKESAAFTFSPTSPIYCNSAVCNWSSSGSTLAVTMSLGRIREAPTVPYPYGGSTSGDLSGVLLSSTPAVSQAAPAYGGIAAMLLSQKFRFLRGAGWPPGSPAPLSVIKDLTQDGWNRFNYVEQVVDLQNYPGRFLWVEYGAVGSSPRANDPRFLVALWRPTADPQPQTGFDCILFYSPSTATTDYPPSNYPFRSKYPYIVAGHSLTQPYVDLGYKYLFIPGFFAQALAASGRPCAIAMPIFPNCINHGDDQWQPFDCQAGVYRLFLEVSRFINRLTHTASSPTQYSPPPAPRNLVLAAYSSGSAAMLRVLPQEHVRAPGRYLPQFFEAPVSGFQGAWRELWGLDLDVSASLGTSTDPTVFQQNVQRWLASTPRFVRLYHSSGTTGNRRAAAFYPGFASLHLTGPSVTSRTDSSVWAEDLITSSQQVRVITASQAAITASSIPAGVYPSIPAKGDPWERIHPFMAELAFGHAASLRYK
jgi:hypothetical protein